MQKYNVITLGISGFPFLHTAPIHKCLYVNKILVEAGFNTLVVNSEAILPRSAEENFKIHGYYEEIKFHYTLKAPFVQPSYIIKILLRFAGMFNEFFFLIKNNFENKIHFAVVFLSDGSLTKLIYYHLLSKILNFKILLIYHEFRSDFKHRKKKLYLRLNDKLFDRCLTSYVDAVIPISEFLISHIRNISTEIPIFKLPPLADFSLYNKPKNIDRHFFLFCGSSGYIDIIEFIINSFELINSSEAFYLYLVLGGDNGLLKTLNEKIDQSPKKDKIVVLSNISFEHLIALYINAEALLIPLKPDVRDRARFPQKVAEYSASGNPIISTNIGEIKHYFNDGINALLAEEYDVKLYSEKLDFVIQNPIRAQEIGQAGKQVGLEHFYYISYTDKLKQFIHGLLK